MKQALSYKFKINDIGKYSQRLKFRDINWALKKSALGKELPDSMQRGKKME